MNKKTACDLMVVLLCTVAALSSLLICRWLYSDGPAWIKGSSVILTAAFVISAVGILLVGAILFGYDLGS